MHAIASATCMRPKKRKFLSTWFGACRLMAAMSMSAQRSAITSSWGARFLRGSPFTVLEPLERHRRLLSENLTLNGLTNGDFTIHPEGLTSSEGSDTLMDRGYSSRLAGPGERQNLSLSARWKRLLESIGLRRSKNATLTIRTITLDTLVRRIGREIDLLQMDVQGLEVEVLKGGAESLKAGAVKTFLIGTHGRKIGLTLHEQCRDLLQASGYAIEIDQPDTREQPDGILVASK